MGSVRLKEYLASVGFDGKEEEEKERKSAPASQSWRSTLRRLREHSVVIVSTFSDTLSRSIRSTGNTSSDSAKVYGFPSASTPDHRPRGLLILISRALSTVFHVLPSAHQHGNQTFATRLRSFLKCCFHTSLYRAVSHTYHGQQDGARNCSITTTSSPAPAAAASSVRRRARPLIHTLLAPTGCTTPPRPKQDEVKI